MTTPTHIRASDDNFSADTYKPRLERLRLIALLGEADADAYLLRRDEWRRVRYKR